MKISREVKTAILVLSGIAFFIYMYTYLKGEDLFDSKEEYYTEFDYKAVSPGAAVTIKGNTIGKVESVDYMFDTEKTRVTFSVNPKLKFSKNSTIRLYQTGIMGGNALSIIDAKDQQFAKPGDVLKSDVKPGLISSLEKDFTNVGKGLDTTLGTADTLMTNLNAIVIDESNQGLKYTIAELNETLKSFKNLSYSINKLVSQNDKKLTAVLDNFNKISTDLSSITGNLKNTDLNATVTNLNQTLTQLQTLLAKLDTDKGTLGKLINDDKLYNNLEAASKEMQLLLLDIKLHPARYRRILSKKEIPYTEPTPEQINNN